MSTELSRRLILCLVVAACGSTMPPERDGVRAQDATADNVAAQRRAVDYANRFARPGTPEFYHFFYEALRLPDTSRVLGRRGELPPGWSDLPFTGTVDTLFRDPRIRKSLDKMLATTTIWNGTKPQAGELLAVAGVIGRETCSGTLISSNAVLTAAHCGCGGDPKTIVFGGDLNSSTQAHITRFEKMTPGCTESDWLNGDLALAFIEPQLTIQPMAIADLSWMEPDGKLLVAGFGNTKQGGIGVKMKAEIPVVSRDCQDPDSSAYGCSKGREAVAGKFAQADTCVGDSGGPAIVTRSSVQYVAATTSRSIRGRQHCGYGGIYVRLDGAALAWIRSRGVTPQAGTD